MLYFSTSEEPKTASAPEPPKRPTSEIKYIDEENDEETETDRLLPVSTSGSDASGPRTPSSSESDGAREPDTDERSPMISRGGPNNVVEATS